MIKNCCVCKRFHMCDSVKAIGLSILAFNLGIIAGMFCPLHIFAVIELAILTVLGYLCLFKW